MASDSPGTYGRCVHASDGQDIVDFLQDAACSRGNYQMNVVGGLQRDGLSIKDSGYYVNTSDGASTCSSSTTETGENEGGTLLVLEPKSLRSFTTNDEYLYAMKEDLADWFACLYQRDDVNADNFFQMLETGVLLCRHANKVQEFARQRREMGETLEMRSYFIRSVPEGNVGYREAVKPETFQARDNVSNFISWGRQLGIPEVLSFETDDLVLRKNEKSVILCLLEIARVGAKLGMLAPTLIQMEQEIDAELAGEEPKPQIQIITCDMRSLDERVRDLIGRCTCPVQFPMIKVGEGKYKIGDTRSLIFVRILRNHVMVRVGGGWDTLEHYLNKHDPCQCNYRGHRPSNAGIAHKVAFSQQRQPATPNNPVCRTTPNTPTSPRRGSTAAAAAAAADRHRSTSPQNSNTKAPTVIISRQMPIPSKRTTDPAGQSKAGRVIPAQSTQSVASDESLQPSSCLSNQPAGCTSTNPARRRSISPQTSSSSSSSGLPLPKSGQTASSNSSPVKGKDLSREHRMLTPKKNQNKSVDSDNEDNETVDNDGYVAEDDECDNPLRPDHAGSESFDGKGNLDSSASGLEHIRKSDTTCPTDGAEKSSMNIDKISTMTLAEFKSMLSSSLSVPEEQKQGSRELQEGRSSGQAQGMPSSAADPYHWNSQKASSVPDSASSDIYAKQTVGSGPGGNEESVFWINRPKPQKVLPRNAEESNTADILRPKTPTSLSRSKMSKPSAEIERTAPKEEYKMARPKPASQIKRDAVAKVAGAISNWVESRNDADSTDTSYKPKTPTRPKTLVGPHGSFHQDLLPEDDEGDHLGDADTATNSLLLPLASRERPVTPSRIPKPSFIPRPKTPSSFTAELPGEASSQSPSTPNLTRLNIALANRPTALSRSNSNSSSVKSVDETPVSPASSFSEDRMFKVHSRARRLSNSSDSFNTGNSAALTSSINSSTSTALSTNTSGRSYKDIYVAKKAATDCRVPPTRAVTPGPREKWTLGGSGGGVSASESQNPAPNTQRRRSINTMNKTDSQSLIRSAAPASPIRRTSSASNMEVEPMTITNEIAFSDDEEINEIIKNAALRIKKQTIRSSSVGARKYTHQHAKQNEEEVLMICRDQNMKDTVINNTASKYNIVRRPSSRGSSNGRASPVTVVSRFSQAAGSSMHQQKTPSLHKSKKVDGRDSPVSSAQSAHKDNRTEAWVDTTLTDDKKKPVPPPKQVKAYTTAARELASRPLEEIQAILSEPKNGFVNVDTRGLEAPAENPAMFRKMEKLFEKYREMELKASMNEVLSHGGLRAATKDKLADTQSTKSDSHRLVHGASKPLNVAALKISSGSAGSAAGHSPGQNPAASSSCRTSSNDSGKFTKSSSTPSPFQNILHQTSTSNSPVMESSYRESKDFFNLENSSHTTKSKTPDPDSEHRGLGILQDIDPELAKNPAALISKIKEILKVRPRRDENTKGPTRIPAPANLNRRNRSKSVSNLYSDCMIDANSGSSHDLYESQPDGNTVFHNTEPQSCNDDERYFKKSSNVVSEDITSSADDSADNVPDSMPISVNFDFNDNQNRSETPLPKMATPLTTGRSTLISRKGDSFARNMSQDKENMSTSQSTLSGLSVLTPTEDQAEFV